MSGNGSASIANGLLVSGEYFQTLGVTAAQGRTLEPNDERPGATPVAVLEYGYWQHMFGGAINVVGRTVHLSNVAVTIVGVADESFTRLTPGQFVDFWLPLTQAEPLGIRWSGGIDASNWWLTAVARLRPDVSRTQAQSAVSLLFANETTRGAKPAFSQADNPSIDLIPASQGLLGIRARLGKPLLLLMAVVGLVLLIACANVAGLTLARGAARQKEMAVRLAMGAAKARIIRQLLTESLLLSMMGAALGIALAYVGAKGLLAFLMKTRLLIFWLTCSRIGRCYFSPLVLRY